MTLSLTKFGYQSFMVQKLYRRTQIGKGYNIVVAGAEVKVKVSLH